MDIEKHFIEVAATDTVRQVIDKLVAYEEEKDASAVWLVVSPLGPPWEFSIVAADKLRKVDSADWSKSLEETLGDQFERGDVVPQAILADEDHAFDLAEDSPSQVLIVQDTIGLFVGKDEAKEPVCKSKCPNCGRWARDVEKNSEITCFNSECGVKFRVKCDEQGVPV